MNWAAPISQSYCSFLTALHLTEYINRMLTYFAEEGQGYSGVDKLHFNSLLGSQKLLFCIPVHQVKYFCSSKPKSMEAGGEDSGVGVPLPIQHPLEPQRGGLEAMQGTERCQGCCSEFSTLAGEETLPFCLSTAAVTLKPLKSFDGSNFAYLTAAISGTAFQWVIWRDVLFANCILGLKSTYSSAYSTSTQPVGRCLLCSQTTHPAVSSPYRLLQALRKAQLS